MTTLCYYKLNMNTYEDVLQGQPDPNQVAPFHGQLNLNQEAGFHGQLNLEQPLATRDQLEPVSPTTDLTNPDNLPKHPAVSPDTTRLSGDLGQALINDAPKPAQETTPSHSEIRVPAFMQSSPEDSTHAPEYQEVDYGTPAFMRTPSAPKPAPETTASTTTLSGHVSEAEVPPLGYSFVSETEVEADYLKDVIPDNGETARRSVQGTLEPPRPLSFGAKIAARMQAASSKVESALKTGAQKAAETRMGEKYFTHEGGLTDRGKKIAVGIGVIAGAASIVVKAWAMHKFAVSTAPNSPVTHMIENISQGVRDVASPTEITGSAVPQPHEAQLPSLSPSATTVEAPVPNPGNVEPPTPPVEFPPRPETIQLAPGETVWGRLYETMSPNATNQDMVNELVRFFEANNLPIKWDSKDPFEAARSITSSQVLLMPK